MLQDADMIQKRGNVLAMWTEFWLRNIITTNAVYSRHWFKLWTAWLYVPSDCIQTEMQTT